MRELHPDPASRERFLGKPKEEGRLKLLDEFRVLVNLKRNISLPQIPSPNIADAPIREETIRGNERLYSGMWGAGLLIYDPPLRKNHGDVTPVIMEKFKPFQAKNPESEIKVFSGARGSSRSKNGLTRSSEAWG